MFFNSMQRNVAARQTDYAQAQERAVSGKRVESPSDDPFAFAQARTETGHLARAQSYERTIETIKPSLQTADNTLTEVDNIMRRVRDIAVEGANDTLVPADRTTLSNELGSLRDQLVQLGNSVSDGRFIFGGYKDDAPPYDAAGVYNGDANAQEVEVSRGVKLPVGLTGDKVFGAAGADIFTTITTMQTALTTNVGANLSAVIPEIDTRMETMRAAHSQIGIHQNAADIALAVSAQAQDSATATRSNLVEIDAAKAYTDLARATTALQAAIQLAGQLPPPGLVGRSR
jgi:flagellar hook-associated protein 3 FlgL